MGAASFTLASNIQKTNSVVTANGLYDLWLSADQSNPLGLTSLKMVIDYKDSSPGYGGPALTFEIGFVIEARIGSNWYPIAYQFEPYRAPTDGNGKKRILVLQPDISTFDAGIDDVMWVGGETVARVSRQQGKLGDLWRARMIVRENGYGGAGAFQSVTFDCYGETYDA